MPEKKLISFLEKGHINFPDEVVLGKALAQVYNTPAPVAECDDMPEIDRKRIRQIIDEAESGYISTDQAIGLLDAAGVPRAKEVVESDKTKLLETISTWEFPIVMKVVGPLHKSDAQGVVLNIPNIEEASLHFDRLVQIEGAIAVMAQPMLSGIELFIGVKKEVGFNHTIFCGLGGIFIEIMDDVVAGLSPLSKPEIHKMITSLKGYKLLQGARGKHGVNEPLFVDIIQRISALVEVAPEITEMDINPLLGNEKDITAVDIRICIEKE